MRSLCVSSVFTVMWTTRIAPERIVSKTTQNISILLDTTAELRDVIPAKTQVKMSEASWGIYQTKVVEEGEGVRVKSVSSAWAALRVARLGPADYRVTQRFLGLRRGGVSSRRDWRRGPDDVDRLSLGVGFEGSTDLAKQIPCHNCVQLCIDNFHLQNDFSTRSKELYLKDSRRLVSHRRLYFRVLDTRRSSSNETPLRVCLLAPDNWCGGWKESRERIKTTRQMIQSHPVPGNGDGKMSQSFWLKIFTGVVLSMCALKSHPISQHVSLNTSRRTWPLLIVLFLASPDDIHFTSDDWNQEYPLCHFAGRKTVWSSDWTISSHNRYGRGYSDNSYQE